MRNFCRRSRKKLPTVLKGELKMAGVEGFEPSEWRDQNPLPYRLATPQHYMSDINCFVFTAFRIENQSFLLKI